MTANIFGYTVYNDVKKTKNYSQYATNSTTTYTVVQQAQLNIYLCMHDYRDLVLECTLCLFLKEFIG